MRRRIRDTAKATEVNKALLVRESPRKRKREGEGEGEGEDEEKSRSCFDGIEDGKILARALKLDSATKRTSKAATSTNGTISKRAKQTTKIEEEESESEEADVLDTQKLAVTESENIEEDPKPVKTKNQPRKVATAKEINTQHLLDTPEEEHEHEHPESADSDSKSKQKGNSKVKRKTKAEKEAEMQPLAARTAGLRMFIGAHVSMAKGVENSVTNAAHIGGNAFALFLKSQRKWDNPPLKKENRDAFVSACKSHKYDANSHVLPHGSYLVNLATEDPDKAKQAYAAFVDDLKRCESLGIKYYNFHPGTTASAPLAEAISRLATQLNRALSETSTVVPVLENMAGSGNVIGSRFSDLSSIIAEIKPEYQSRIGVCMDTCHAFAAGYDLRTPAAFKATLADFDSKVGIKYLKALHLNDSKAPFSAHRDLHANIGTGFLGLRAFHNVMNEPRFENLPLVLETPCEKPDPKDKTGKKTIEDKSVWAREIKLLESLIGMDVEGAEFKKLEKELSELGKAEREKMQKTYDEKVRKDEVKAEKGQRSIKDIFGGAGTNRAKKGRTTKKKKKKGADESDDSDAGDSK